MRETEEASSRRGEQINLQLRRHVDVTISSSPLKWEIDRTVSASSVVQEHRSLFQIPDPFGVLGICGTLGGANFRQLCRLFKRHASGL